MTNIGTNAADWDYSRPSFKSSEAKAPQESDMMRIVSLSFPPFLPASMLFNMRVQTGGATKGIGTTGDWNLKARDMRSRADEWVNRVYRYNMELTQGAAKMGNNETQAAFDAIFGQNGTGLRYSWKSGKAWLNKPSHQTSVEAGTGRAGDIANYEKGSVGTLQGRGSNANITESDFKFPGDVVQQDLGMFPTAAASRESDSYADWLKELFDDAGDGSIWEKDLKWDGIDPLGEIETQAAADAMYSGRGSRVVEPSSYKIGESMTLKGTGDLSDKYSTETIDTIIDTKEEKFMMLSLQKLVDNQGGPADFLTNMNYFEETRGSTKEFWKGHNEWESDNTQTVTNSVFKSVKKQVDNMNIFLKKSGIGADVDSWSRSNIKSQVKATKTSLKGTGVSMTGSPEWHLEYTDRIRRVLLDEHRQGAGNFGFTGPVSSKGHFGIIKLLPVIIGTSNQEHIQVNFQLQVFETGIDGFAGFIDLAEIWAQQDSAAITAGLDAKFWTGIRSKAHNAKAMQAGRHLMMNQVIRQQLWSTVTDGVFNPRVDVIRGMTTKDIAESIGQQISVAALEGKSKYREFYQSMLGSAAVISEAWKNNVGGGKYEITPQNLAGVWPSGRQFAKAGEGSGLGAAPYLNSQLGSQTNVRDLEALWAFSLAKTDVSKITAGKMTMEQAFDAKQSKQSAAREPSAAQRYGSDSFKGAGSSSVKKDYYQSWKANLEDGPRDSIMKEVV